MSLSKKEAIFKAYQKGLNVNDISEIVRCSSRYVRKILKPYKTQTKEAQKVKAKALKQSGKSCEEIADILDLGLSTVYRWLKKNDADRDADEFEEIKITFNKPHWGKDVMNTFLCLTAINRDLPIKKISKSLNVSKAFVLITACLLLTNYTEGENNYTDCFSDYFEISEERAKLVFLLRLRFPRKLPDRKFLYIWMSNNNNIYKNEIVDQYIYLEKSYWQLIEKGIYPKFFYKTPEKSESYMEGYKTTVEYVSKIQSFIEEENIIE